MGYSKYDNNVPVGKQKLLVYACNTAAAIFMEHWGWLKYQPSVTVLGIRLKEGERRKKYACLIVRLELCWKMEPLIVVV